MTIYRGIEINVNDNIYVETKGLNLYLDKEISVTIGSQHLEDYVDVIKYIVDYITINKPTISENQNIGYYSWLLQFRSENKNYYDLYEVNSDGSDVIKGCDIAVSFIRNQSVMFTLWINSSIS